MHVYIFKAFLWRIMSVESKVKTIHLSCVLYSIIAYVQGTRKGKFDVALFTLLFPSVTKICVTLPPLRLTFHAYFYRFAICSMNEIDETHKKRTTQHEDRQNGPPPRGKALPSTTFGRH